MFNESLHPNSSSYHASPFSQYLHQDSTDFGSVGGLVQNLQGRLNTWVQTSPTVLGFSQELLRSGNIADEYRLQALEAGEYILAEVQKDAVQIFDKTSAIVSSKAQAFVIAHPEFAGQVDEFKHQVVEATDQVTEEVSKTLKAVGLKTLSTIYDGLKVAYDRSDQMTTEFPGRWKLFVGTMAERTLQVREAVQDAASKAAVSLRDQSISGQVSPGGGIIAPTLYGATPSTLPIVSGDSTLHTIGFEGNVIAEAGAIVRSGAGRSFQATAERYGFNSKVRFDAWKTGEMVDYSQELGQKSDRWYRIEGTDRWVSGAIVHTNANLDDQAKVLPDAAPKVTEEKPFMGRIIATQANVRSGAGSQFEDVGDRFYGDTVEFDGWVKGEFVDYQSTLGTSSDKWFRIKGANQLISAALVTTNMDKAAPAVIDENLPNPIAKVESITRTSPTPKVESITSNDIPTAHSTFKIKFEYDSDEKAKNFFDQTKKELLQKAAKYWSDLIEVGENGISELTIKVSYTNMSKKQIDAKYLALTNNAGGNLNNLGTEKTSFTVRDKASMHFGRHVNFGTGGLDKSKHDFLTVAQHEIGHALGIGSIYYGKYKHSDQEEKDFNEGFKDGHGESKDEQDIMYKSISEGQSRDVIKKSDLAYLSGLGYRMPKYQNLYWQGSPPSSNHA